MKLVVPFFLFLCFHLLGGNDAAPTTARKAIKGYIPAHLIEAIPQAKQAMQLRNGHFIKNDSFIEENDPLLGVDDEDEDDSIKKLLSLAGFFLILSFVIISSNYKSCRAGLLFFNRHIYSTSTPRYIVLRTIRI